MEETTNDEAIDEGVGEESAAGATSPAAEPAETAPFESEMDALRRERDEAQDRILRLQADFQNQRRHAQAKIDAAAKRARAEVLGEAVTILDYLDMALAMDVSTEEARNLQVGVEMTRGQLQALFERMDVQPIDATGPFDPAVHQAVSTVATDEVPPGTIVEVVRGGWTMDETVLRFAQVRVAASREDVGEEAADAAEEA